jgi:hypothetical protein
VAVDAFAQQVGVPAVPGVLLDPVYQQLLTAIPSFPLTLAWIRMLGQYGVSRGLLVDEVGIRGVDHGLLGDGAVKVGVAFGPGLLCDSVYWLQRALNAISLDGPRAADATINSRVQVGPDGCGEPLGGRLRTTEAN